jgi:hypothetical protein
MYKRKPEDALCRVNFDRRDLLILIADLLTMMSKHGDDDDVTFSLVNIIRPMAKQSGMLGDKPCKTYEAIGLLDLQCRKSDGEIISAAAEMLAKEAFSQLFNKTLVVEIPDFNEDN